MQPYKMGFDEFGLGLACLNFVSREHVDDIAMRGPDAVHRALSSDQGIAWDRFIAQADFSTDPLLSEIMTDRAINPIMMAVESAINTVWTEKHFDAERMDDSDVYHLYRMRHYSIVHGAMVPRNRLAVDILASNVAFSEACWDAFGTQKPVDFATENAMLRPEHIRAILVTESVRAAVRQVADLYADVTLADPSGGEVGENGKGQIARQYEANTGLPLFAPTVN